MSIKSRIIGAVFGPRYNLNAFNKNLEEFNEITSIEVPDPAIAEDFSSRLAHIEQNLECLDLPAMRGWDYRPVRKKAPEV